MTVPYGFLSPQVRYPASTDPQVVPKGSGAAVVASYALLEGIPRVPNIWFNATYAVSCEGAHFTDRAQLVEVNEDAFFSFLPTEDTVGPTAWLPYRQGTLFGYQLNWVLDDGAAYRPILADETYQLGRELFDVPAVACVEGPTSDEQMFADFGFGSLDFSDLTLAIAMVPRKESGTIFSAADGTTLSATTRGYRLQVGTQRIDVAVPTGPIRLAPLYLVIAHQEGRLKLLVGYSPTRMYQGSALSKTSLAELLTFTLSGACSVLSLDVWGDDAPTAVEIVGRYASVFGSQ